MCECNAAQQHRFYILNIRQGEAVSFYDLSDNPSKPDSYCSYTWSGNMRGSVEAFRKLQARLKAIDHPKLNILLTFTHPKKLPFLHDFLLWNMF